MIKYPSLQIGLQKQLRSYASQQSLLRMNSKSVSDINEQKKSKEFIPFCKERDLGKLLSSSRSHKSSQLKKSSKQQLLEMVTFKNFKKLYNLEKRIQESKYALEIRQSGQKNLIDEDLWLVRDIRKIQANRGNRNNEQSSLRKSRQSMGLRDCCRSVQLKKPYNVLPHNTKRYSKIDLQLYKKMSINRPPNTNNPQLTTLYQHYIQSCQLNQNQRRRILTQKVK